MSDDWINTATEENKPVDEGAFSVWLPAGLTLMGIGVLTLLTPFFTQLDARGFIIDMIAGSVLVIAGTTAFIKSKVQNH